jgi:hypothetical protein
MIPYDFLEFLPHLVCHAPWSTPTLNWLLGAGRGESASRNHGPGSRPSGGEYRHWTPCHMHAQIPPPLDAAPMTAKTIYGKIPAGVQSHCCCQLHSSNCNPLPTPTPEKEIKRKRNTHMLVQEEQQAIEADLAGLRTSTGFLSLHTHTLAPAPQGEEGKVCVHTEMLAHPFRLPGRRGDAHHS